MKKLFAARGTTDPPGRKYKIFWTAYWIATLVFLFLKRKSVTGGAGMAGWRGILVLILLIAAVAMSAFVCVYFLRGRKKLDERGHEIRSRIGVCHIVLLMLNAVYCFWAMEIVNNSQFLSIKIYYMALNVAGILIMTAIWLCWLNSWRRSLIAMVSFYTVMTTIFDVVLQMRGEPFQFIDVFSLGTAMEVAGNYEFRFSAQLVSVIVLSLCILAIYLHLPDAAVIRKGLLKKILLRAGVTGFMIGMYFFYLNVNWNGGVGILTDLFAPEKTYQKYGTSVGFFCVAKYMRLTPPDGYSVEKAKEIAEKSETEQVENTVTDTKPVNVIAIMNESWADYRMVGDLETNQEVMPYYDSLKENTIKGHTLVNIRGGGTAKTEYEFLTGNSVKRFPAMVPYVSYFTHSQYSLVTTLEAQGYHSIAMHPYKASNWNRPTAYRLLNFDEFESEEDWPSDAERIRGLISDQADYEEVIRRVEEKDSPDDPLFIFNITMQNHGGYTASGSYSTIHTTGEYQNDAVNNYLSLLKKSDEALQYLIEYFKQSDEPTIIVMFGDHYPGLPDEFTEAISGKKFSTLSLDEEENYYATPFLIWANYDIPEAENITTSTNFLGTMMLENTGLQMAPYNYYLKNLQKTLPALNFLGYMDANGKYHRWAAADEEHADAEWEYEVLQYNNLAERGKRLDWFFSLDDDSGG